MAVAHGGLACVRAGRLSLVPSVAGSLLPQHVDNATYRVEHQHSPDLFCLASAFARPTMASPSMDDGRRVSAGAGHHCFCLAELETIALGGAKGLDHFDRR